ncbi:hypothetical protein ISCGN_026965 [Ixodes scapularis]
MKPPPQAGGVFQSSEAGCSGDLEVQVQSASFEVSRSDVLASSSENDSSEDDTSDEYQSEESADHNSEPPNGSANPNAVTTSSSQPHELSACDELASIAGKHNMSHVCLNDVLAFCRRRGIAGQPKDARTVLCTERKSRLEQCDKFVHFGLEEGIRQSLQGCPIPKEIKLQGNIDGLPLFKSAQVSFWPLLCRITNLTPLPSPFMVSLYCGTGKPPNLEQYLYAFLEEAHKLTVHGMVFKGSHITVSIMAMVCDAPARSFIKQIVGHTGYHACERCSQRGLHLEGRMTFPDLHSPQRTNESFRSQEDEHHHTGTSPFESLDADMVSWFPTEYMHLVSVLPIVTQGPFKLFMKPAKPIVQGLKQATCEWLPVFELTVKCHEERHCQASVDSWSISRCLESGVSTDPEPCGFARPRLAVRGFPVSGEKGILVVELSPG